jgi:hypothetical protein
MVLAVGALGFSVWKFGLSGGRIDQPDSFMTVDIMTGQLYDLRKGKARGMTLPSKNPETGERTLFPVEGEDGNWRIVQAYMNHLTEEQIKKSRIKGNSGTIEVLDAEPVVHIIMP